MPRPKGECFGKKVAKPICGCCPTLADEVRVRHKKKTITCAQAFALAESLKATRADMGKALDTAGIKVVQCQLGCFQ
ncbi:MAG: hypothetical protein FJ279_27360 [Planctomycetes bacterium]|nr:hypothetical protein [Planctomycetota bacterium]